MRYRWPELTLADAASFLRLLMVIVAAAGLVWVLKLWLGKQTQSEIPLTPGTPDTKGTNP